MFAKSKVTAICVHDRLSEQLKLLLTLKMFTLQNRGATADQVIQNE